MKQSGFACDIVTADTTTIEGYWLVRDNVTIDHDLQIGTGEKPGYLILVNGVTLTVNGSVMAENDTNRILAQSENYDEWGTLVINAKEGEPAIKTSGAERQLLIYGGKLVANSSGRGAENVELYDSVYNTAARFLKCTLDGADNNAWRGVTSLPFTTLVLEGCDHEDGEDSYLNYVSDTTVSHDVTCERCGYAANEPCTASGGYAPEDENGHYQLCKCGNRVGSTTSAHSMNTLPTEDGKKHVSRCRVCDYAANGTGEEDHDWNTATGACKTCGFAPVARVKKQQ